MMIKSNLFKTILKCVWEVIYDIPFWSRCYKNKDRYPMDIKYKRLRHLVNRISIALQMDIHAFGINNIPNETSCFLSNHMGAVDPVTVIKLLDKPMTFLAKKELERIPGLGKAISSIEGEFLDREDLKKSLRTMMRIEEDLKSHRKNWLIFPEGTRNKDNKALLRDFHYGTFRAPTKAEVPLVPVCIYGTQRVIDKTRKMKKYPIYIEFGKPLYPNEYKDMDTKEVAKIIQSRVQEMLSYHARKFDREYCVTVLGDKFIENF